MNDDERQPTDLQDDSNPIFATFKRLGIDFEHLRPAPESQVANLLKAHTIFEAAFHRVIRKTMRSPEQFDRLNLKFPQLVHLALALELLPKRYERFFFALERERNRLAHELGATISVEQISALISLLPEAYIRMQSAISSVIGKITDPLALAALFLIPAIAGEMRYLEEGADSQENPNNLSVDAGD